MTSVDPSGERRWLSRISLSEPDTDGRVIVSTAEGPALRLPAGLAPIIQAAQDHPDRDPTEIAKDLGVTADQVQTVLDRVGDTPAVAAAPRRPPRVQFRPPFTVQFTLFDPSKLIHPDSFVVRVLRARATWPTLITVNGIAAVLVAVLLMSPSSTLSERLTVPSYGWLLAGLLLSVFIHEFAHAATLIAHGGTTHRMGFMFFYLVPAFFCDVRDIWSVPPQARVRVALAGVMSQGVIAAICGTLALFTPPTVAGTLTVLAVLNMLYWIFNLIPFVKFDGYVALAGHLDRPNLREQTMAAFRDAAAGMLYGHRRRGPFVGWEWTLFGAASMLFPFVLILGLVLSVGRVLASLGVVAIWIELSLVATLLVWAVTRMWKHVCVTWRSGTPRVQLATVWTIAVAAIFAAATLVPIPQQQTGGVFVAGETAQIGSLEHVPAHAVGSVVTVRNAGTVPGDVIGSATVDGPSEPCTLPLATLVAVQESDLSLEGYCAPLSIPDQPQELRDEVRADPGTAEISLPSRNLVEHVVDLWQAATS
ncbi:daptide biosynthesis intramembrane metalloprotease [Nesterenkonia halobia]|uniref:Peptide zinc metalloprotease protein n=1 Tax=Nesterenkonia halobia TaxID=37922 RepID=A0ABP6RCZ3_9MICC